MLAIAGLFSPLMRELRETTYQFRAPFVVDSSKFERTFGVFDATRCSLVLAAVAPPEGSGRP
jgi:hypothetical protein